MPDLSAITMRMLKEKIAPKFGDEWEEVSNKYKALIKEEAVKLIEEAEKSPAKERKKKIDPVESKSTPSTVQKKDGRVKSEASASKSTQKKFKGNSSSDEGGCSDDFKEESSRHSGSTKISKKKDAKYHRKEEPLQKKDSAPVQSAEVIRLKSLAKQCGYTYPQVLSKMPRSKFLICVVFRFILPTHLYKGFPPQTELQKRIGNYLLQKGLPNLNPSSHEISRLKKNLQLEVIAHHECSL